MRTVAIYRHYLGEPGFIHHVQYGEAWRKGLERHGIKAKMRGTDPVTCDVAIMWSQQPYFAPIRDLQKERGQYYITMENGWYGEGAIRVAITGPNYQGYCNENSLPDRWEAGGLTLKSWRRRKGYVLIVGQTAKDYMSYGINVYQWAQEMIDAYRELGAKDIVYRPHPREPHPTLRGARIEAPPLDKALAKASVAVMYNASPGVKAIIAGVPCVIMNEQSIAYPMAGHTPTLTPPKPDREQWAYDLAYTQWTEAEIISGAVWEHLKGGINED